MKRTFTYIRNCLISLYSHNEIESFISIIFEHIYNYSKHDILLNSSKVIPENEFERIKKIVDRLKIFEPIQYILGETYFYDLKYPNHHVQ